MKLSTKGRYGLRALIDIAVHCRPDPVSISAISRRQGVSTSYLEQLASKLKKAGFIKSVRGVRGGYTLSLDPGLISIGDVLRALEGDLSPVECAGLSANGCLDSDKCVSKQVWKKINDSVNHAVDALTLSDLMSGNDDEGDRGARCDSTARNEAELAGAREF